MINKFFNVNTSKSGDLENELYQNLYAETIQINGVDVEYIRRSNINLTVFNESPESSFSTSDTIEMYLDNVDGFGEQADLLTTFGLDIQDRATFNVARKRWFEEFDEEPFVGDLIYFSISNTLFEIKHVEDEQQFFPTGKKISYKITCEIFSPNFETFDTGIEEVDSLNDLVNDDFIYQENDRIQEISDSIQNFDEDNPFGRY